jgi:DNA-binding NtrC family response regulator
MVGHGMILIIDDEPSVRRTVSRMLEHLGFTTLQAEGGVAGVAMYRENADRVALVMLDLTMPMMNGEQTFKELVRIQADVRVVLMSGFNQGEALSRFTGKGLTNFLQKPFSLESLRHCLESVLQQQS